MLLFRGKTVYKGIAMGPVRVLRNNHTQVKRQKITNVADELRRLEAAITEAKAQLQTLYEKAVGEVGESGADIFAVHQMMLEDTDFLEAIYNVVKTESVNGEYAVAVTGEHFSNMFATMNDAYMQARAADVKDISERVIGVLMGNTAVDLHLQEPAILVADAVSRMLPTQPAAMPEQAANRACALPHPALVQPT